MSEKSNPPSDPTERKEIEEDLAQFIHGAIEEAAKESLGVASLEELDLETFNLLFGGSPFERNPKKKKEEP